MVLLIVETKILQDPSKNWNKASIIIFTLGNAGEELLYSKSSSMFLWMLGYEFTGKLNLT